MRFAYADPPYPGCAKRHYANDPSGIKAEEVDHAALIETLRRFDGWALSTSASALLSVWNLCPEARVAVWVKPFTPFRSGQRVAWAWEPVLFCGGRTGKTKSECTVRDWVAVSPPVFQRRHISRTIGEKPGEFCFWLFALLGMTRDDEFVDLFPGSGAVSRAWESFCRRPCAIPLIPCPPLGSVNGTSVGEESTQ